ncbi:hypothetical protein PS1_019382 [Malus domestica]
MGCSPPQPQTCIFEPKHHQTPPPQRRKLNLRQMGELRLPRCIVLPNQIMTGANFTLSSPRTASSASSTRAKCSRKTASRLSPPISA